MAQRDFPGARHHAIVIGASLTGLLAARVLADHFDSVTLVERDAVTTEPNPRKGVPQGHHVHGLLAKGQEVLSQLFPDLVPALLAGGAISGDMGRDIRWHDFGVWKVRFDSGIGGMLLTRPYLEGQIAERVRMRPNVRILEATVDGLAFDPDGKRVTGVRIRPQAGGSSLLIADLTIDASGRGSHTPQWLEALGYCKPAESTVKVNVMYASRLYRPGPGRTDWKGLLITPRPPDKKMATVFAVEGNRWLVTLGGFYGVRPPTDEAGYLEFARTLPVPDVYRAIASAEPLTPIATHKFPTDIRRRYERMKPFPERFVVMGDAFCSFNPVYAQGMTVAAREAMTLDHVLRERTGRRASLDGLPARFHSKIADIIDSAWGPASAEDFRHEEAVGERPPGLAFIHWYTGRIHERCAHDTSLALAFYRVMHMIDPPAALFRPSVIARVLRRVPKPGDRVSTRDVMAGVHG
jgi:2-polyprenyl-6-methoxyphenol hydroxylase-like FAD-dependent oxidoreductase